MKVQHVTIMYVIFLLMVSLVLDFELVPRPRYLVKKYVPSRLLPKDFPRRIPYDDKIAHFFLAGLLSLLINLSLSLSHVAIGRLRLLKGSVFLVIIITLEELSQALFPSRSFSLSDLFANYAGVFCFGRVSIFLMNHRACIESRLPQAITALIWPSIED